MIIGLRKFKMKQINKNNLPKQRYECIRCTPICKCSRLQQKEVRVSIHLVFNKRTTQEVLISLWIPSKYSHRENIPVYSTFKLQSIVRKASSRVISDFRSEFRLTNRPIRDGVTLVHLIMTWQAKFPIDFTLMLGVRPT